MQCMAHGAGVALGGAGGVAARAQVAVALLCHSVGHRQAGHSCPFVGQCPPALSLASEVRGFTGRPR